MKEFIVGSIIFVVLMFFPLQWVINEVNHYKMQSVNNIVHVAAQKARTDGYFTEANINQLKTQIADALSISDAEIRVNVTTSPKYRFDGFDAREMIHYEIGVPIDRVIAMNIFFNIDNATNQFEYIVIGEVASELLAP